MQLCSSCFSAYVATLTEDNIREAGADIVEKVDDSMDAIKACLLMAHNKNEVFSLKMKSLSVSLSPMSRTVGGCENVLFQVGG